MSRRSSSPVPPDPATVEEIVALTLELTAISAPTGAEDQRAQRVAELFAAAGLAVERDAVGNVLAWRAEDDWSPADAAASSAPVVLTGHLDTVFGPEVELAPRRDGDRLLGPGIGDNTVAVATLVVLGRELAAGALGEAQPLVLAATVGEEGLGDLRGVKHLLGTTPVRAHVSLEGHLLDEVVVGGIGSVRLRARYAGPGGHSWGDRGTPSAADALLRAGVAALDAVPPGRHVNVGVVRAGTAVNAIAAAGELVVDLRDEDEDRLQDTAARVAAALETVGDGVTATVERVGHRPAGRMDDRHPLLRAVRSARGDVGLPPAREDIGSTECNAAYPLGVPTVCVGLTHGGDMHRESEWISVPPLASGLAAVRALVRRLVAV
ncbi:M20/M25/M40 family metallo-hydrolase [Patulibacter sp. SYSU D01012]|uniref:M20/M25/M40 family metallo-hydrolase n=1 Tax=Patulibacter sp. SYSU D01012 TaxID=2817381 RepID=UPI001B30051C|nr:M20/M25/M40 family metallo-hydrolase [Patulibacter sp. SYSU D01012]